MKYRLFCLAVVALTTASCSQDADRTVSAEYADTLFVNGAVYTMDATRSWTTAVGVRNDKIVFVGFDDDAAALQGPATRVIDLGGKMLMPSFQDVHIHPIYAGQEALTVDLNSQRTLDGYLAMVKSYADANPELPWIVGGGWSMAVFGPGVRTSKKLLDAIVPDRPVFLTSADGHTGWANSAALKVAGIDQDTQDPNSGIIDRDASTGEIIGSLQEGAMELVTAHIPPITADFRQQALQYSVDLLNRYGITAITDAAVYRTDLDAYRALDERGELSLRVVASIWWELSAGLEQIENIKRLRSEYTSGNLTAGTVKIMQDGVMENHTAVMSDPYLVAGNPTGIAMVEPGFLKQAVTALDAAGFQVHFHAIGDLAISQCLDAVAEAIATNGDAHRRHHISHIQAIHPKDLSRFRELGVVANFQPLWAYADSYITDLTLPFIGEERANWLYTIRSVINAGGMVAFGSDWSVSTANPFPQIETAVTRTDAEANDQPFMPQETIDLATALAAFTINAAYVHGIEMQSGSIEVGKLADLIVLDRNIFDIPIKQISETKVLLTLFGGQPVHGELQKLAAR
ncbi:MAG: amidohydrolase family protein [Proteobacteria bacterium]|nr:amidohydrolase family protein [Pseudomonadota bacterium]MDA1064615.1 amidohydrolase family protein [Pseudomonadota bacterium]